MSTIKFTATELIAACAEYSVALEKNGGRYTGSLRPLRNRAMGMVEDIFDQLQFDENRVVTLPSGERVRHISGKYCDLWEVA